MKLGRLKEWREARGHTQQSLSEASNVGYRSIQYYESAENARPRAAKRLADALNVQVIDLMDEQDVPQGALPAPAEPNARDWLEDLRSAGVVSFALTAGEETIADELPIERLPESWVKALAQSLSNVDLRAGDTVEVSVEVSIAPASEEEPVAVPQLSLVARLFEGFRPPPPAWSFG